jgi:hypothetical protein
MIVVRHYPRRAKRRANVAVVLGGDPFYVPRHRQCTRSSDVITIHYPEVPVRVGRSLGWQCLSCGRVEEA